LGDSPLEVGSVIEELGGVFVVGDHEETEVVEGALLLGLPVIVVEVVINPHELLVYYLRGDRLLEVLFLGDGQLHLKSGANPRLVDLILLSILLDSILESGQGVLYV
jgi:hypothetical protein